MRVLYKKLTQSAIEPSLGTVGSAGLDIFTTKRTVLKKGIPTMIPTGIAMEIPIGFCGVIYSRSSSAKKGIVITPLIIDSDFRGEIFVLASYAFGDADEYVVEEGDRIAQLRIEKVHWVDFVEADELSETARGAGGYGSTGR